MNAWHLLKNENLKKLQKCIDSNIFDMKSNICYSNLFQLPRRTNFLFIVCAFYFLSPGADCRNIRGHSRYSRPRPNPHVVENSLVLTSAESNPNEEKPLQGRRCQVTNVDQNARFLELPYYNEGRTIIPFFLKISGKSEIKPGKWKLSEA